MNRSAIAAHEYKRGYMSLKGFITFLEISHDSDIYYLTRNEYSRKWAKLNLEILNSLCDEGYLEVKASVVEIVDEMNWVIDSGLDTELIMSNIRTFEAWDPFDKANITEYHLFGEYEGKLMWDATRPVLKSFSSGLTWTVSTDNTEPIIRIKPDLVADQILHRSNLKSWPAGIENYLWESELVDQEEFHAFSSWIYTKLKGEEELWNDNQFTLNACLFLSANGYIFDSKDLEDLVSFCQAKIASNCTMGFVDYIFDCFDPPINFFEFSHEKAMDIIQDEYDHEELWIRRSDLESEGVELVQYVKENLV